MLLKTKGIVIKQTKFSDSGVIVKIFTEELGVQSFFVRGLRSKKSKSKSAMFQPLNMLELEITYSEKKTLHNIKEVTIWYAYQSVTEDMKKRTMLFFINELLHKSLKEETENKDLFNWIHNALVWLDLADRGFVNFHLVFMMQLSMFLGFYPKKQAKGNCNYFDLIEGKFSNNMPVHQHYVTQEISVILDHLRELNFEDMANLKVNNNSRKLILEALIDYYKIHLNFVGNFKSLDVLSVILS